MESTVQRGEWLRAVRERDRRLDGTFVYGVRSTRIYCRPSCPSRRPREDQVVLFLSTGAAREAGFRPCLRCRPDGDGVERQRAGAVERLCRFIETYDSADTPLTLAVMSEYMKMSPHHLQRTFSRAMGISPRRYADQIRVGRLKTLVRKGEGITDALYEAGYGSSSRLYEGSDRRLGMTPGAYKRGGRGMRIRYTIVDCPLGRLLVGATDRGVSAVSIGNRDRELEEALRLEYPSAEIVRDSTGLDAYVETILSYLQGKQPLIDLPRDVRVTGFQARVYDALRAIPYGTVRTYAQIAATIGDPKASRAVGNACAANPTALIVPCHRVVKTGGAVGGYRWGEERKKALLVVEASSRGKETFENGGGI